MADEGKSPAVQQHHAELAEEHKRKADFHEQHSGGKTAPSTSKGPDMGGVMSFFEGHKLLVIGGIAVIIIVIFAINIVNGNNSGNTANQSPNNSAGGYVPSDIGTALDSINNNLSSLGAQLTGGSSSTGTTNTGTTTTQTLLPLTTPGTQFQAHNISHFVSTGNETLSQYAQDFGLQSWNSIYAIPQNQQIFGRMDYLHARNFTPPSGEVFVLPSSTLSGRYQVLTTGPNTLSGIAQSTGITLSRIENLNPNLPDSVPLSPGQEVRYA